MFSPTDVVVIVKQARNLVIKAKSGINDAYATIELLKDKYVTGVQKSLTPEWFTECTFSLPQGGVLSNKAVVTICLYHKHHGKLGLEPDDFLGRIQVPLPTLNTTDSKERSKWYKLMGRKSNSKKERGEIEVSFQLVQQNKDNILPAKTSSPKSIRLLASGLKHKWRRRSEDEDSGLGVSDNDRLHTSYSVKTARSYENLAVSSLQVSHGKHFEKKLRSSSTNSSPAASRSARGSSRLLHTSNPVAVSKAMSVEVLHKPDTKVENSSLQRLDSGSDSGARIMKRFFKTHKRNRSLPEPQLTVTSSQLRKDETTRSAICVNGPHLYIPGSESNSSTPSPEVKPRFSSMDDLATTNSSPHHFSLLNKNQSNSKRSKGVTELEAMKNCASSLSAIYKPKTYYRLDVKELCKVSTIPEDSNNASYQLMTHGALVKIANSQKQMLQKKDTYIRELEDYIDSLLVKVMTFTPHILDGSLTVCTPGCDQKLTKI